MLRFLNISGTSYIHAAYCSIMQQHKSLFDANTWRKLGLNECKGHLTSRMVSRTRYFLGLNWSQNWAHPTISSFTLDSTIALLILASASGSALYFLIKVLCCTAKCRFFWGTCSHPNQRFHFSKLPYLCILGLLIIINERNMARLRSHDRCFCGKDGLKNLESG